LTWRALSLCAAVLTIAGCGQSGSPSARGEFEAYLARVEPIRLQVNRLLDRADPTLSAFGEHRLGAGVAQGRIEDLERRFAPYVVKIAALAPVPAALRSAQASYAHTYVLEDAYLSALAAALPEREFDDLPDTQSQQRASIIAWRVRLEVLASRLGVRLPADIQAAGRGEIAPSPSGS
jgi:NAD-dependent oxidoreductase involved in siderophore biosynthesis